MLDGFLREDDICYTLMKEISPRIKLEDFEEMYKEGGRPPVNPKVLLLVLIMQFVERLSDRAAAYNLRYRIDWKIALGVELEFEGVHPTTLVKFRDRLISSEKASYAFDKVIEYLVEQGLVRGGGKHRIDSTHIIGKVRELSRLELFHETLRLFCSDIVDFADEMPKFIYDLFEYYLDEIAIRGISDAQKKKYLREAGAAMRFFIDWAKHDESEILKLSSFKVMKKVYEQNFKDEDPDPDGPTLIKIATGKDHICSPHETDARYANKGGKGWLGYKAQVVETVNEGEAVNFITHAEVNDATDYDGDAVSNYVEEQKQNAVLPSEVYGDTHYNTADNIQKLANDEVTLKGPVVSLTKKKNLENIGFAIDQQSKQAVCPDGQISEKFSIIKGNRVKVRFSKLDCERCERKAVCKPNPRGKQLQVRMENDILTQRRQEMMTEEFKIDMYRRNGIEGTISGLVRGAGLRLARYRGKNKVRLQIKFSGAAANVTRLHRKLLLQAREESLKAA